MKVSPKCEDGKSNVSRTFIDYNYEYFYNFIIGTFIECLVKIV